VFVKSSKRRVGGGDTVPWFVKTRDREEATVPLFKPRTRMKSIESKDVLMGYGEAQPIQKIILEIGL
jgi:hypothetical protein